jgi:ribosomal-protein-alanine N-acetyltransferase
VSSYRRADLSVRPARSDDLPELRHLIETSSRAHLNLDWWTLDDWAGNPAFLVVENGARAESGARIVAFGMGVRDVSPLAWLRALVVEDGLGAGILLDALFPPLLDALRVQGVPALACLAWAEWLAERLPGRGFAPMAHIVTLRKDRGTEPALDFAHRVAVREARPADLDAVAAADHAAFEPEWWYGRGAFDRMWHSPGRFVVAKRDGELVGYAFGDALGLQAHIVRLAVHPAHQKHGIGAQLLADLVSYWRAQGVSAITVNTQTYNEASLRLYRRFDFCLIGQPVTAWRLDLTGPAAI